MHDSSDTLFKPITLQYLQDTLFGVNPLTAECMAHVQTTAYGVQLRLTPPWPHELKQAHTITFKWAGDPYQGVVKAAQTMDNGELLLEIQHPS